jgi:hypothetical protein
MQASIRGSLLQLGAKRAFLALCGALRERLGRAQERGREIHAMLEASFTALNAEYGFSLATGSAPDLGRFVQDLEMIERNYVQYLGLTQALKLTQARFLEQFRRMLVSRLRVVFESASVELELWNKTASSQIDAQLRDRRRAFKRRRDALERIQSAAGELETRLLELEAQEQRTQELQQRLGELLRGARAQVELALIEAPAEAEPGGEQVDLLLDFGPEPQRA